MLDPAVVLEAGAKAALYASLLVVIGANAARWLLLPRVVAELGVDGVIAVEQSVARLALVAALGTVAALALRLWTHTVAAFGFGGARSWDALELIAFQSRWSYGWKPEAVAAVVLVLASIATVRRRAAWPLATLAVLAFAATIPLIGHAAGDRVRMALHTAHILGGGLWLGTLEAVLLVRRPRASQPSIGQPLTNRHGRLTILRWFSPIALTGCGIVLISGVVTASLYVGAAENLWLTVYGRVLLLKVALVGAVSTCGYVNWDRLRRLRTGEVSSSAIIVLEAILAIGVVLVTGYLTETSHP